METTSPFKALQDLQEEQREGWMPASDTSETDKFRESLEKERDEALQKVVLLCRDWADDDTRIKEIAQKHGIDTEYVDSEGGYFKTCVDVAEKMSEAITELNQRLTEQRESFMAQLVRIEDGWREKLVSMTTSADMLYNCIKDVDDLTHHELDCLHKHEKLTGKPSSFG